MRGLCVLSFLLLVPPWGGEAAFRRPLSAQKAYAKYQRALKRVSVGRHTEASRTLFGLLSHPGLKKHKKAIRYHLADSLYQMKLYHPALFQFQSLIKSRAKGYRGSSLKRVAWMAALLKSDRFLHYAISEGSLKYIPAREKQKLYYHFGEYWMRRRKFHQAIAQFSRVKQNNAFFYKALYQLGLAHAELGRPRRSARIFRTLESRRSGITDQVRVGAIMGQARAYYQSKQWDKSIENYQKVPKDSVFWHDTLLEKSWALLRSGKFRSTLSNFHTLHSAYYENHYQPESLLLRAIVYLYICKYYEMEKVLELFHKIYRPVYNQLRSLVRSPHGVKTYYRSLQTPSKGLIQYPPVVTRRILREGDFLTHQHYIQQLQEERNRLYRLPLWWRRSSLGRYSISLVQKRLDRAQRQAGKKVLRHLNSIRRELKSFLAQEQFIRYEMLRSRRIFLKKKIARRDESTGASVEDFGRSFYIQNGYEYWPFQGEYWLDELGNYHYVGMESCNK